jgi:hypothetical protein
MVIDLVFSGLFSLKAITAVRSMAITQSSTCIAMPLKTSALCLGSEQRSSRERQTTRQSSVTNILQHIIKGQGSARVHYDNNRPRFRRTIEVRSKSANNGKVVNAAMT